MPQGRFYRYISHPAERENFRLNRVIHSTNPVGGGRTWSTNQRLESSAIAQASLALPSTPRYEVGPIPEDEMPFFNVCCARRVEPGYGNPGGGVEFCTTEPIYLFRWLSFEDNAVETF